MNFKALKNAIPEIDAVNNDDEYCYDVATAVKFHQMMYGIGVAKQLSRHIRTGVFGKILFLSWAIDVIGYLYSVMMAEQETIHLTGI